MTRRGIVEVNVPSDALAPFRSVHGVLTLDTKGQTLRMVEGLSDELSPGESFAMVTSLYLRGSATGELPSDKRTQLGGYDWLAVTSRSRLIAGGPRVDPTEVYLAEEQPELPQRLRIDWPDEGTLVFRTLRGAAPAVVYAVAFLSQRTDSDSDSVDALIAEVPHAEELREASMPVRVMARIMMFVMVFGLLALPVGGFFLLRGNGEAEPPDTSAQSTSAPNTSSPPAVVRVSPEDEFVAWVRRRIPGSAVVEDEVIIANGEEICRLLDGTDSSDELLLKLSVTTLSFDLDVQETADVVVGATRTLCPRNRYLVP